MSVNAARMCPEGAQCATYGANFLTKTLIKDYMLRASTRRTPESS